MVREVQEVDVTIDTSPMGGEVHTHPAFGAIRASRVSGRATLHGSEFNHQHYVSVTICNASFRRSLSNDWPHAGKELISVDMSESQWATFISSLNHGSGTQCTLSHIGGKAIPGLPDPKPKSEQFKREVAQNCADAIEHLRKLSEQLKSSGLSGKKLEPLLSLLNMASREIGSSQQFVLDQFGEHMEATVSKAKAEVEAYINGAASRIHALASAESKLSGEPDQLMKIEVLK